MKRLLAIMLIVTMFVSAASCSATYDLNVEPSAIPSVTPTANPSIEPSTEPSTEPVQAYHTVGGEKHLILDTELTVRAPEEIALLGEFYKLETLAIEADSLEGFDLSVLDEIDTLRSLSLKVGKLDGAALEPIRSLAISELGIHLRDAADTLDIPVIDTLESLSVCGDVRELRIAGGDSLSRLSFADGSVDSAEVDIAPKLDTLSVESYIGKLTIGTASADLRLFAYRPIGAFEYGGALSATVYTDGFDLSVLTANDLKFLQISDWYDYDLTPLEGIELVDGLTLRVEDQENETIAVPKDSELWMFSSNKDVQKNPSYVSLGDVGTENANVYPPDALYALETDFDEEDMDILVSFVRQGGTVQLGSRYNCKQGLMLDNDFGYSDILYTEQSIASDIGGDTDIIRVGSCHWSSFRVRAGLMSVDKSREYVMGPSDDSWLEGRLEKLGADGEWQFYSDINCAMMQVGPIKPQTKVDGDGNFWEIEFPMSEPGKYKIIGYFREVGQEEIHSINFTVEVPERTDCDYDLCGMWIVSEPAKYDDRIFGYAAVRLRSNYGAPLPYLDTESIRVRNGDAELFVWEISPKPYHRRIVDSFPFGTQDIADYYTIGLRDIDPDEEYILSMRFTENEDGSGERYDLTLRLRFGK